MKTTRRDVPRLLGRAAFGGFVALMVLQLVTMIATSGSSNDDPIEGRSSLSRDQQGLAALARLLGTFDVEVDALRGELTEIADPNQTVFLIDPPTLDPAAAAALRSFVERGGRLVTGGPDPFYLSRVSDAPPTWDRASTDDWEGAGIDPDIGTVRTGNEGEWTDPGGGTVVVGTSSRALVTIERVGVGEIVFLADATVLTNELLPEADNAAFAVALVGDRDRAAFVEGVHGADDASGLGALPDRWKTALGGLSLAGLALMWSRGVRLGPPEPERRSFDPPRAEYVRSLADTLVRTGAAPGGPPSDPTRPPSEEPR